MLKVLCIGDPHIKVSNIPEVNLFIKNLLNLVKNTGPDLIIVLGDILDTFERINSVALNKAHMMINKLREVSRTYVLVGNHDMYNHCQFLTENHWMNGMKEWANVTIVDKIVHEYIEGFHLVFSPYVPPGRFEEALNSHKDDWKDADCIFAHQEFFGCKMGAITSVEGDKWPEDFPEIVSGHIHSKQSPQPNIYYSGSAMQHAFGESEKNIIAFLTWETPGEKYTLEEFDLELPRKRIVYTDVAAMEDYQAPETKDQIKITISGVYDEFKAFKKTKKYRELIKNGTKVVFKPKKLTKKSEKKDVTPVDETSFSTILSSLVNAEKNTFLCQVYELVVNDKKISEEDLFFPS